MLLVHFGINKRPNELKTKKGRRGEVKDRKKKKNFTAREVNFYSNLLCSSLV